MCSHVKSFCGRSETQTVHMYLPDPYCPLINPQETRLREFKARRQEAAQREIRFSHISLSLNLHWTKEHLYFKDFYLPSGRASSLKRYHVTEKPSLLWTVCFDGCFPHYQPVPHFQCKALWQQFTVSGSCYGFFQYIKHFIQITSQSPGGKLNRFLAFHSKKMFPHLLNNFFILFLYVLFYNVLIKMQTMKVYAVSLCRSYCALY